MKITSAQNPTIKQFSTFTRRKNPDLIRLDGPHLNKEYVQATGTIPTQTLVSDRFMDTQDFIEFASWEHLIQIPDDLMARISPTKNPSGILSLARKPNLESSNKTDLVVILENIQDPGNLGTMLRTANAMGPCQVLLLGNSVDIWNDKCLRAGMGAQFYLSCEKLEDLATWKQNFKGKLLSAHLDGESLWNLTIPSPLAFVFGNEGQGVTPETEELCDQSVKIPMNQNAESLNVAASMAILTHEFKRQQSL